MEFDTQAKKEKAAGLVPAPFMANISSMQAVAKLQCTFIDFVIKPYFSALAVVLPELNSQLQLMTAHRAKWQALADDDDNAKNTITNNKTNNTNNNISNNITNNKKSTTTTPTTTTFQTARSKRWKHKETFHTARSKRWKH